MSFEKFDLDSNSNKIIHPLSQIKYRKKLTFLYQLRLRTILFSTIIDKNKMRSERKGYMIEILNKSLIKILT